MKISVEYKIDHRIKLVQINSGAVKFLVPLRIFESEVYYEDSIGKARVSVDSYKTLYKERLMND